MRWLLCEMIAQRTQEPVAFLAQLGRDHRKYGVTQRHYDSMQDALQTTLRSHSDRSLGRQARRGDPRRGRADHRRDARRRGRRDRPAMVGWHRDRTSAGVPRRVGGPAAAGPADGLPPRPVRHGPGAAVAATVALPQPGDPRRPGGGDRVPRPLGHRRHGQHRDRRRDQSRRPVAVVQPRTGHGDRPRWRRRADGRRRHRSGAVAHADHGPHPFHENPRVHLFFGARYPSELYDLRTLWQIASTIRGCR